MSIKSFIGNLLGMPKYHCFIHEALTRGKMWEHSPTHPGLDHKTKE